VGRLNVRTPFFLAACTRLSPRSSTWRERTSSGTSRCACVPSGYLHSSRPEHINCLIQRGFRQAKRRRVGRSSRRPAPLPVLR
jgi:hypothetical protein